MHLRSGLAVVPLLLMLGLGTARAQEHPAPAPSPTPAPAPAPPATRAPTPFQVPAPIPPPVQDEQGAIELTLDAALARASESSEEVLLSLAAVQNADAQVAEARSAGLPQLSLSTGYVRTFQSGFQSALSGPSNGDLFAPDPTASVEERLTYLEQNAGLAALGAFASTLSSTALPFGRTNTYSASISGQQVLYSGGRVRAGIQLAREARAAAVSSAVSSTADIRLQVRVAYVRALLAGELVSIAEAALVQAQSFLDQERLRQTAGFASDLDVLRAEVSLENLRPQLIAAQNASQLALLNVKRLVNVPMASAIRLTTPLQIPSAEELADASLDAELVTRQRAIAEISARQVSAQEQNLRVSRGARLPSVSLQMSYGGQAYPQEVFGFSSTQWLPDWTATLGVQLPLFTGFQTEAAIARARVGVRQSELQLAQTREALELEYQQAVAEKARARASIGARQRTVEQAQRVYDLTVLRYGQGLATQLEVSQARLELLQSRSNLAQAIADFHLAGAGVSSASAGTGALVATNSSTGATSVSGVTTPPASSNSSGTGFGGTTLRPVPSTSVSGAQRTP